MFLDPDPKRRQPSMSTSALSQSRQPVATSARDIARLRRQPLQESPRSREAEQRLPRGARKSTVRLVDPTPSPPQRHETNASRTSGDGSDGGSDILERSGHGALAATPRSAVKEASVSYPGILAASGSPGVSDADTTTNEAPDIDGPPSITLLSDTPTYELAPPIWHRRSTSSGDYSQSSTLHDSEIAFSKKSLKSERLSGLSQFSTLRGTPSPYEQENRERAEKEGLSWVGPAESLHTLQEVSPERSTRLSTIRAVSPSDTSSPSKRRSEAQSSEPQSSESSPSSRPRTNTLPSSSNQPPNIPPRISSRRNHSTGSIPFSPILSNDTRDIAPASPSTDDLPESRAIPEAASWQPSSPNFIAYTPDSARSISTDALRRARSIDSINSRLQTGSVTRPETGRSLATTGSRDSLQSNDTLPPLFLPKKRLRHKAGSASLSSLAGSSRGVSEMSDEDFDSLPYPKRPFSSHLSTIVSESEGDRSRTASQHLSHFSLGSGVLTGDDSSIIPQSPKLHRRNDSAPRQSLSPSLCSRETSISQFDEDAGDMTLGIFREESAVPQPLFNAKPQKIDTTRKYDGPLPPMPPIPPNAESDENMDTLSALKAPPLRQQRSGKSLRGRANNVPAHSRQQSEISYADSERFSNGSSIFPTWAKHFYAGTVVLTSKASFGSLSQASRRPGMHQRNQSSVTERSITSRLGAGMESGESSSPTSSHFLPAIFRPRTRLRAGSAQRDSRSSRFRRSGRSRTSQDRPSQDSMAINPIPPSQGAFEHSPDVLPSGQPRWGTLKGSPESQQRPLPRIYSKQRQWDQMSFPRPMTKDRLSEFGCEPHLAPSKRSSQNQLSTWQAPSFVSGLDTLITSRCNRQILLFMLGFVCPFTWMLAAVLPLPRKPTSQRDLEKQTFEGSEEDVQIAMMKHEAGDAERRWREERTYLKARWWRMLNRIMSVVGALVLGAVIALIIVATT